MAGPNEGSTAQVYILGFGTTLGVAAMAIVLVPYVRMSGIDLRWRFQPRHPAVKAVVRLSGWTVGFAAANQVALMIILNIARTGEAGAVSAYQYAFIFFQLPHGLVAVLADDGGDARARRSRGGPRRAAASGPDSAKGSA